MADDIVCTKGPFRLVLNFLDVDSSDFGVRANLHIEYAGNYQRFKWELNDLWIVYEELRRFERELCLDKVAILHDMSDYPILRFEHEPAGERLIVNPPAERQSLEGEELEIRLRIEEGSIHALHSALSDFAKWW
jgi:hypothetical protein